MRHLIVLLLMVISVPASAEIYSWTDTAGTGAGWVNSLLAVSISSSRVIGWSPQAQAGW